MARESRHERAVILTDSTSDNCTSDKGPRSRPARGHVAQHKATCRDCQVN